MSKRPLRAILFDVDDTIYSTTEFAHTARKNAIDAMIKAGLDIDPEVGLHELEEVVLEFGSNDERHFDKLLQRLPLEAYEGIPRLIIIAAGMVAYHQTKFRHFQAYEDAIQVLNRLKEMGLRLGIVTAGVGIKQAEKVVRLGLHQIVDPRAIFITDSIGISKMNPKIYLRACAVVGVSPEECIYVGDNPAVDIDVPHRVGMRTILSRRSGKYMDAEGTVAPDHVVHNFWDILDVVQAEYAIVAPG